ncbi:MAG: ribbon-helix-helix protein, CopG family [Gemmatimonadetes bacterium]|nr:ribbon-helix-helix protein, CopG family [Gemmatimonadota bacterium]
MPDTPLSVRLPADLTDALDRRANERGVGRSLVVREAVAAYLTTQPAGPAVRLMPVAVFLDLWATAPRLNADEAAAYAADLRADRASLGAPDDPWG